MSTHEAGVAWTRGERTFTIDTYPRDHLWRFGSGSVLGASAAPAYHGNPTLANPEEAFVVALSSCHMLTFLALAARARFVVDSYQDGAVGTLAKDASGRFAVTKVLLRPRAVFSGERRPTDEDLRRLHDEAHKHCFIANSVTCAVAIEPR